MGFFSNPRQAALGYVVDELLAQNLQVLKNNRALALRQTLRDIGEAMFEPGGIAIKHIEHFLSGSGDTLEIDATRMLRDNPTVKRRVESETRRRALRILTLREASTFNPYRDGIDPILTVFQKNFDDRDWWGALGTYEFEMRKVERKTEHSDSLIIVNLYGKNEYKWYKDRNSATKAIHQLGAELEENRWAKNFWMTSKPLRFDILGKPASSEPLGDFAFAQENPEGGVKVITDQVRVRLKRKLPNSFWVQQLL